MISCISIFVPFFQPTVNEPSMKMEALICRFPHLQEQIFQKLDNKSLFKSREVARSWLNLIEGRSYSWLRIANIPKILKNRNTIRAPL